MHASVYMFAFINTDAYDHACTYNVYSACRIMHVYSFTEYEYLCTHSSHHIQCPVSWNALPAGL